MESWFARCIRVGIIGVALVSGVTVQSAEPESAPQDEKPEALRVCQDPNNLPNSNLKGQGFENKIAEMLAKHLDVPLEYYSTPQRLGFVRNTLKFKIPGDSHYRCDVVMTAPLNSDQMSVTKAYFRSGEMLVVRPDSPLAALKSSEDLANLPAETRSKLKIGVYDRDSSASLWLVKHGFEDQAVPYRLMDARPDFHGGELIEHLIHGDVDAILAWGPTAGYYAKKVAQQPLVLLPLIATDDQHPTVFAMGMGLRYGEPKWKATLQHFIDQKGPEITAILKDYGIPLLDDKGALIP